ncbi:MAG: NAD-dependent epimerase/dehydratase family protein [Chthoniobacteraceae bacterium]|nr:NAD-dependent epimerase/dehydratase family protein [Chthoniobacteraceae bacterium]
MKLLLTGVCGFVGGTLARALQEIDPGIEILGIDNFSRPGSECNRLALKRRGVEVRHADLRSASDIQALPAVDYVIDAAANPSVLAGVDGQTGSRQLLEHNLGGTLNLLEYCKAAKAGFILLSTSRVYALEPLASLPVKTANGAFEPDPAGPLPPGLSAEGVAETFSTQPPLSLYGTSKRASELLALEYGAAFGFPVWINRCGVLAGAGQFGRADQGIFTYWINAYLRRRPLQYIGFGGTGAQVRDCLHPADLAPLLWRQIGRASQDGVPQTVNLSGGRKQSMSLAQLSNWCADRFGRHEVAANPAPRRFDIPWMVLDSTLAAKTLDWRPERSLESILAEIAAHAHAHPDWLEISAP